jgi:dipeptidyl aminopeptidase/acylaminoacyl peptidase
MRSLQQAPYGSWRSPITASAVAAGSLGLGAIVVDGGDLYWAEGRPEEGGRVVIVRQGADGATRDVIPAPYNARTRVHEYGGGAYAVRDGTIYFSHFGDNRVYRVDPGGAPRAITPADARRYADLVIDGPRGRLLAICEDHSQAGREAVNTLVALDAAGERAPQTLAAGHDFYSSPALSPDGRRLAWLAWNHPNMPFDGTELWLAEVAADGSLGDPRRIAGGLSESVTQPAWSPAGVLHFVSDRSGWWNLYRWREGQAEPLAPRAAEFARPQWTFGQSYYAVVSASELVAAYTQDGVWRLALIDTAGGAARELRHAFPDVSSVQALPGRVAFVAGFYDAPAAVVTLDLATQALAVVRQAGAPALDPEFLTPPTALAYPTTGGLTAYGFYYPPRNPDYSAPSGERPPLYVAVHGGPTGQAVAAFSLGRQYFTSRGLAVLVVNYGGSTGYGRAYRERLNGTWGVVDVEDSEHGARHLIAEGLADAERVIIEGGSAGGYTTLRALTVSEVFKAGASYFGIADLASFAAETHKFESRYLDRLVGPLPEQVARYRERSPIHALDRFNAPVLLLQGLDDRIVPPNQSEMMFTALRARGIPVAYLPFPGEGHGFRREDTLVRALEAELYFYSRVFGFALGDAVDGIEIENLAGWSAPG